MAISLRAEVTIGNVVFSSVVSVGISSTWRSLGDKATIELPNLKGRLEHVKDIKVGSEVVIKLGSVELGMRTEFSGFVTQINPNVPLEILCEDYAYKLRSVDIQESRSGVTLSEVADIIASKTDAMVSGDVPSIYYEKLILDYSAYTVLRKFVDTEGLVCYFRGKVLYMGLQYGEQGLGRCVVSTDSDVISTSLEYMVADSIKYRAVAIGYGAKGNKVIVEGIGPADGVLVHLPYVGVTDVKTLKDLALKDIENMQYGGYTGSVEVYGHVYAEHGWTMDFKDVYYPERSGSYIIDEVSVSFGAGGFRRTLRLGKRIS